MLAMQNPKLRALDWRIGLSDQSRSFAAILCASDSGSLGPRLKLRARGAWPEWRRCRTSKSPLRKTRSDKVRAKAAARFWLEGGEQRERGFDASLLRHRLRRTGRQYQAACAVVEANHGESRSRGTVADRSKTSRAGTIAPFDDDSATASGPAARGTQSVVELGVARDVDDPSEVSRFAVGRGSAGAQAADAGTVALHESQHMGQRVMPDDGDMRRRAEMHHGEHAVDEIAGHGRRFFDYLQWFGRHGVSFSIGIEFEYGAQPRQRRQVRRWPGLLEPFAITV